MITPGFRHDQQQTRVPTTYDASSHTVDCIVASGSPVREVYGSVILKIRRDAVDLSLLHRGRLPLLYSHDSDHVLGRVTDAWFRNRQLHATLHFDRTTEGRAAEDRVARGELFQVSCRAKGERWTAKDADGEIRIMNPDFPSWGGDGSNRVFTAQRWKLAEISLTTEPRDRAAVILSQRE